MSQPDRSRSRKALVINILVLLAFFVAEALGGYFTNSLALMADAGHILTDVGAMALALLAIWVAQRPPTPTRTYGYHRVEILAALANGLGLWLIAIYVGSEAFQRFAEPPQVRSLPMLLVALAGLGGNLFSVLYLSSVRETSLNVRAAFLHVVTDTVQSVGVVGAGVLMLLFGWYLADPVVSMVVAVLIVVSGTRVTLAALDVLLESAPAHVDVRALRQAMEDVDEVAEVHDLHTWTITSGYHAMSAHVVLRRGVGPERARVVLDRMQQLAQRQFGISHITIQIEDHARECPENHHQ